jgi:homoserine O-acetyltransferase
MGYWPKVRGFAGALIVLVAAVGIAQAAMAQSLPDFPNAREGDFPISGFQFKSGETIDTLNLHYLTFGKPVRDKAGHVTNAVMILHGTGGTGRQFIRDIFSDVLFKSGGMLDAGRYFIILPDSIGHGKSSKPSDGLRAAFPHYDYDDMVEAQYRLARDGLGIDHLRLILGTSMGCMHAFVWGEMYPDAVDALMPLACLPQELAGRNRLWRKMAIDAIEHDPTYNKGNYTSQPQEGLRTAADLLILAGAAPVVMQKNWPTRAKVDTAYDGLLNATLAGRDANDLIYQLDASRNYNPAPNLAHIKAPVMWINSADDFINPPELGLAEPLARQISNGRFILLPISDQTRGHGTHTIAALWQSYLEALLAISEHP